MNTAAIRTAWAGRVIAEKYTLLECLGGNETSAVFRAELSAQPSRQVAIKLSPADEAGAEARLIALDAAAALSHPYLLGLIESGRCQVDGEALIYVVMEFAEENLAQVLPERPLTAGEAVEMLDPVLEALDYLHGKGLVHGRWKPGNILVVDNQVKISSDGLMRAGEPGVRDQEPSILAAPEAATSPATNAEDVWGLGVLLVEALTQHPPAWDGPGHGDPLVPPSLPQPLADIVRDCLRVDPAQRCTLGEIKARLHPQASVASAAKVAVAPKAHSKLGTTALIAALVVLLVLAVGFLLRMRRAEPGISPGQKQALSPDALPEPSRPLEAVSDGGASAKGAVAARVMPEILPAATKSIHGGFDLSIRVKVDAQGGVTSAELDASGPSKYFAKQALQAARQWRFTPAQVNGQAASSVWVLKFHFTQSSTEITPVETEP